MASDTSNNRAKFSYVNRDEIEKLINKGKIDVNDIIYTKDTHENIFIGSDLSVIPIQSKVYRFKDVTSAEKQLNSSSDTYEGQIVAIYDNNAYTAYIVNKNKSGSFYVTNLSIGAGSVNYDNLGDKPIFNMYGDIGSPIIISDLSDGIYKIKGNYKITENDVTTYASSNDTLFLISRKDEQTHIRKITSDDFISYTISNSNIISTSSVLTEDWINRQNYATTGYVDNKIAALDFIKKEDVSQYVESVVSNIIDDQLDERMDAKLNESFTTVEDSDIQFLF